MEHKIQKQNTKINKYNMEHNQIKNKTLIGLFLILLAFFSFNSVNAVLIKANTPQENGIICYCNSCDDCTNTLNDNSCTTVKLTTDILIYGSTCIYNPVGFNNKVFDCQGHTIDGDNSGTYNNQSAGIYLNNKRGNTIENCVITNFYYGIGSWSSSHNTITNNTVNNNNKGILLYTSSNNILVYNIANNNNNGIYLADSPCNSLYNNIANHNKEYGFYLNFFSNPTTITDNTMNNNNYEEGQVLFSSCNIIVNNTANYNSVGFWLDYSLNSTLINNTANNNKDNGIYLDFSSKFNILYANHFCSNSNEDIYNKGVGNNMYNNTCDKTSNGNNEDKNWCTYKCNEQKPIDKSAESLEPNYNSILLIVIILLASIIAILNLILIQKLK